MLLLFTPILYNDLAQSEKNKRHRSSKKAFYLSANLTCMSYQFQTICTNLMVIKLYSHQMFFFRVDIDQFVHRNSLVLFNLIALRLIGPKSTLQINVLRVEAVVSYATIVALVTFHSRSIPFSEFLPSLRFLYICLYCHLYILWSSFGFTLYGDV